MDELNSLKYMDELPIQSYNYIFNSIFHKDGITYNHQKRVANLAVSLALYLGRGNLNSLGVYFGGLFHDVGKLKVPNKILNKQGPLSYSEFKEIKKHPYLGYKFLKKCNSPELINKITCQHHERYDGSGYPKGLKGEDLLEESVLISLCDVFDCLIMDRPYCSAFGIQKTLDEFKQSIGTKYHPKFTLPFIDMIKKKRYSLYKIPEEFNNACSDYLKDLKV